MLRFVRIFVTVFCSPVAADILPKQRHFCTMFTLSRWFWWMSLTFLITTLFAPIEAGVAVPSKFVSRQYLFALPEETECTFVHAHRLTAHVSNCLLVSNIVLLVNQSALGSKSLMALEVTGAVWRPSSVPLMVCWQQRRKRRSMEATSFQTTSCWVWMYIYIYRLLYVGHTPLVGYFWTLLVGFSLLCGSVALIQLFV